MREAATAPEHKTSSAPIDVTLADEAASTLNELSARTGLAADVLLSTSIALLKIAIEAQNVGRRLVLTTRLLWPIREVRVP